MRLTVVFVYMGVDDIGSAIIGDVANAKALPISEQADQVASNFATADVKA